MINKQTSKHIKKKALLKNSCGDDWKGNFNSDDKWDSGWDSDHDNDDHSGGDWMSWGLIDLDGKDVSAIEDEDNDDAADTDTNYDPSPPKKSKQTNKQTHKQANIPKKHY